MTLVYGLECGESELVMESKLVFISTEARMHLYTEDFMHINPKLLLCNANDLDLGN